LYQSTANPTLHKALKELYQFSKKNYRIKLYKIVKYRPDENSRSLFEILLDAVNI